MIYFIAIGKYGPVKIGTAGNSQRRLQTLQVGCPWTLVLLDEFPGDRADEKFIHSKMHGARIGGEWYRRARAVAMLEHLRKLGIAPIETMRQQDARQAEREARNARQRRRYEARQAQRVVERNSSEGQAAMRDALTRLHAYTNAQKER